MTTYVSDALALVNVSCGAAHSIATGGACASPRRSLPTLVAPLLLPHLAAVTDMLRQLFPAAAAMLNKSSAAAGSPTASADALSDDCGNDGLTGTRCQTFPHEKWIPAACHVGQLTPRQHAQHDKI